MPDEKIAQLDIAKLNLACAEMLPGTEGVDLMACLPKLDEWARLVRINTEHWWQNFERDPDKFARSPNRFRMAALATVLQRDLGVHYNMPFSEGEYNATDSRNLFLHGPLNGRGGTCATMPVLYIAVGRRLSYPLKLVEAFQHFFARWDEPDREQFNIECTCHGFSSPDNDHYLHKPLPMPAKYLEKGTYLRSLRPREEFSRFLILRGQCLIDNYRFEEAELAYYYAAQLAPDHVSNSWPIASLLRMAFDEAMRYAESQGRRTIDVTALRFPDEAEWQRQMAPEARECLERILRVRAQNRAAAANRVFSELGRK